MKGKEGSIEGEGFGESICLMSNCNPFASLMSNCNPSAHIPFLWIYLGAIKLRPLCL